MKKKLKSKKEKDLEELEKKIYDAFMKDALETIPKKVLAKIKEEEAKKKNKNEIN